MSDRKTTQDAAPACRTCGKPTANASGVCVRCIDAESLRTGIDVPEHRRRAIRAAMSRRRNVTSG